MSLERLWNFLHLSRCGIYASLGTHVEHQSLNCMLVGGLHFKALTASTRAPIYRAAALTLLSGVAAVEPERTFQGNHNFLAGSLASRSNLVWYPTSP